MMKDCRNKWVLVTGAGSGIGRETALAFAREGASLVITDINPAALEAVRKCVEALGVPCIACAVDVADGSAMRAFADRVHAQVSALDVLVNNAGIGYLGSFLDSPLDAWQRVLGINVMGVVHGCHMFLPQMLKAGGVRRIVNVASLAGVAAAPNMSAYATSKFAVVGLSEAIAIELKLQGSMIGITTVCPGIINTAITKVAANVSPAIRPEQLARLQSYYEANGVGPEVVSAAIVDAVRRGRDLVLVGKFAKPMYHLKRLSRRLVQMLMLVDARKAGYA